MATEIMIKQEAKDLEDDAVKAYSEMDSAVDSIAGSGNTSENDGDKVSKKQSAIDGESSEASTQQTLTVTGPDGNAITIATPLIAGTQVVTAAGSAMMLPANYQLLLQQQYLNLLHFQQSMLQVKLI